MGQKVHPIGFRLGISSEWSASWYAGSKDYSENLLQDLKIREYVKKNIRSAGVSSVHIERVASKVRLTVKAARPGVIIGSKGRDIAKIKSFAEQVVSREVSVNIEGIKRVELDATLVAESIASQVEKRVSFRKLAKRAMQAAMRMGAEGIKVKISGRIAGAEIARSQWYSEGRIPLHELRSFIDYGFAIAHTVYGSIGLKVWIARGAKKDHSSN
ncbi:30S ribosomal protein S3 [Candidatus Cyrtobacter comes]|uniref:Small ribosomal subunit protein uS3 n=1 Tax=Candidatus Cyrtobacter comes TaxID=675776 RepID=A0ABU5L6H3_9RICK|nr:30S ribosomal protein S3 [Candidatus Cyrtobacter comes]MDZ5761728.1 30S ribosomal protein S3 [Candidatus Cyrtobacter comes]